MLLPQTSVASVLNPRISGGAQMTEERGGEESGVVDTTERSREERENETRQWRRKNLRKARSKGEKKGIYIEN